MSSISFTPCGCCSSGDKAWFWGDNSFAVDGSGAGSGVEAVTQIGSSTDWSDLTNNGTAVIGLKTDGTIWFWGTNFNGENGSGVADGLSYAPTQIGTDTNWKKVYQTGKCFIGLKTNGTLWFWGTNNRGENGSGVDDGLVYSVTQIGTDSDWDRLGNLFINVIGIKTSGTIWFWGRSGNGEVGNGIVGGTYAPTQIGSSTWSKVYNVDQCILGIRTNGTAWFWGLNGFGENGSGVADGLIYAPTQIGAATNWEELALGGTGAIIGLRTDGTLYHWGANTFGEKGTGSGDAVIHVPAQIGSASDWVHAYQFDNCVAAVKSTGTAWFWGTNGAGENGSGVADNLIYAPMQIGSATDWDQLYPGMGAVVGLKTGGSIWFFATNNNGEIGTGTADGLVYAPVQIGVATNWANVFYALFSYIALSA
jgi:alpha-tubulin suppressor-like RCC1 family protein